MINWWFPGGCGEAGIVHCLAWVLLVPFCRKHIRKAMLFESGTACSTAQAQITTHWPNQANTNMVHIYMPRKYTMGGCQNSAETRKENSERIKPGTMCATCNNPKTSRIFCVLFWNSHVLICHIELRPALAIETCKSKDFRVTVLQRTCGCFNQLVQLQGHCGGEILTESGSNKFLQV